MSEAGGDAKPWDAKAAGGPHHGYCLRDHLRRPLPLNSLGHATVKKLFLESLLEMARMRRALRRAYVQVHGKPPKDEMALDKAFEDSDSSRTTTPDSPPVTPRSASPKPLRRHD